LQEIDLLFTCHCTEPGVQNKIDFEIGGIRDTIFAFVEVPGQAIWIGDSKAGLASRNCCSTVSPTVMR
jgi:hypothetical protein